MNNLHEKLTFLDKENKELRLQNENLYTQVNELTSCIIGGSASINQEYIKIKKERDNLRNNMLKYKKISEIFDEYNIDLYEIKKIIEFYKEYKETKYNIEDDDKFKILKNKNIEMQKQIDELKFKLNNLPNNETVESISIEDKINSSVRDALIKQKEIFDKDIKEKDSKYNNLYNEFKKINEEFIIFKNNINNIESNNNDNINENKKINNKSKKLKNNEKKNKNDIISLPENLYEIVYYRKLKNIDKFKPLYYKKGDQIYLQCCSIKYEDKEISNKNHITCIKCYNTYKISEKENNGLFELYNTVLQKHNIENEDEIYKKIKCNNCNYIDKKEINICYNCKKLEDSKISVFNIPDQNEIGYESKLLLASETYNKIRFNDSIYIKAYDDGVDVSEFKNLIDYIKQNKLMEEKQVNIIKNKLIRCHSINYLYNEEKYEHIKGFIKRINFSIKSLAKLDNSQWSNFRMNLKNLLDNEINKIQNNKTK